MPNIRNLELIRKFTRFLGFKANDMLSSEAVNMIQPVVSIPILPTIVKFTPTEAEFAAGIIVPSGVKWRILSAFINWTSDVNAGNREIRMLVNNPLTSERFFNVGSRNFQAASLTESYNFFPGANSVGSASASFQEIAIPDLILEEGTSIIINDASSIAAGDAVANATLVVEEETVVDGEIVDR